VPTIVWSSAASRRANIVSDGDQDQARSAKAFAHAPVLLVVDLTVATRPRRRLRLQLQGLEILPQLVDPTDRRRALGRRIQVRVLVDMTLHDLGLLEFVPSLLVSLLD